MAVADHRPLIEVLARALVEDGAAVRVSVSQRRGMACYELQVAPQDLGRVIGRQGRTAAAIRTLLSAAAELAGGRAQLDIRDASGRH